MPISMRDGGNVLRSVTAINMRDAGNTLRTITTITMRDAGNVLRTVFNTTSGGGGGGGSTVIVTPNAVSKTKGSRTSSPALIVTPAATISGTTGSPTYSWARVSGSTIITVATPTAVSTTFSANIYPDTRVDAVFACTVVDGTGTHLLSVAVTIEHIFIDTGGFA